jgi:type VI secretion system ImpM family protein
VGFDLLSRFRKRSADDPPPVESWPVFAFGKLPVYKDFISAGLTDDASREFRDWLSNGFSRNWSAREEYRGAEIPLHAFLLRLPVSRKFVAGALWGSRDQGGLRKFPFAVFSILSPGKPEASALTALDYLPVFEGRAREIRRRYDAGGALAAVYQELRGARIDVPVRAPEQIRSRLAESLSASRVGPLARSLFGGEAAERWPALLSGLDGAARRAGTGAGAFRFPLADEPAPLRQLQLWTVRLTRASPARTGPLGVLFRTGGEVPCGVVFYRDLRPEDILLLHPGAVPTDFVEEIPAPSRRHETAEDSVPSALVGPVHAGDPAPPASPTPSAPEAPPAVPAPTESAPSPATASAAPEPAAGEPSEAPPAAAPETVLAAEVPGPEALSQDEPARVPEAAAPAPESPSPEATPPAAVTTDLLTIARAPDVQETPSLPTPEEPAEPPAPPEPEGWDQPLAALLGSD